MALAFMSIVLNLLYALPNTRRGVSVHKGAFQYLQNGRKTELNADEYLSEINHLSNMRNHERCSDGDLELESGGP